MIKSCIKTILSCALMLIGGWPLGMSLILGVTNSPFYFLFTPLCLYIAKNASIPFLRQIGVFEYYSPMLLIVRNSKKKVIELHSGSIFDMLSIGSITTPGFRWRKLIFLSFTDGLLKLIKELKENGMNDYRIEGSSYFFNAKTVEKFGFSVVKANLWHKIKLFVFAPEFIIMYSLIQGRLSIPPISKIKKAIADSSKLIKFEDNIEKLQNRLRTSQIIIAEEKR